MAQASDEELKSLGLLPNQVFTEEEEQTMEDIMSNTSGIFEPRPRYIESSTPLIDITKALPENIPIPKDIIDEDLRALIRKDDDRFDEQFRKVADMIRKQLVREYFKTEGNIGLSKRMLKAIEDKRREEEARIAPQDVGQVGDNWFQKRQREQKKIGMTQGFLSTQQIQGLPELTGVIPMEREFRNLSEIKNPKPITTERYMELQLKRSGSRLDPDIKKAVDIFESTQPTIVEMKERPYIDIEESYPPSEEVMGKIKKGGALTDEEIQRAIKGMPKGCLPDGCVILKRGGNVYKKFIR